MYKESGNTVNEPKCLQLSHPWTIRWYIFGPDSVIPNRMRNDPFATKRLTCEVQLLDEWEYKLWAEQQMKYRDV